MSTNGNGAISGSNFSSNSGSAAMRFSASISQTGYVEATLTSYSSGYTAIGLVPEGHDLDRAPGLAEDSIGYHCDDGKVFKGSSSNYVGPCATWNSSGSTVGVGTENGRVYFQINGMRVLTEDFPNADNLYACIFVSSETSAFSVGTGSEYMSGGGGGGSDCIGSSGNVNGNTFSGSGATMRFTSTLSQLGYVEATLDSCSSGYPAIGLVGASHDLDAAPGLRDGSMGYHGDDGKVFKGSTSNFVGPCATYNSAGSRVGIGYENGRVYYQLNGMRVLTEDFPDCGNLYPAIWCSSDDQQWTVTQGTAGVPSAGGGGGGANMGSSGTLSGSSFSASGSACLRFNNTAYNTGYVEVTVTSFSSGYCAIGLVPEGHDLDAAPGLREGSIGYHGDDGKVFKGSSSNYVGPCAAYLSVGSRVGVGLDGGRVYFQFNGMRTLTEDFANASELYPAIFVSDSSITLDVTEGASYLGGGGGGSGGWSTATGVSVGGSNLSTTSSGCARFGQNFDSVRYIEASITSFGSGYMAIGAVPDSHDMDRAPGLVEGTVGYHADDGKVFKGSSSDFLGPCQTYNESGVTVGCGIRPSGALFFTRNGMMMGEVSDCIAPNMYPCVYLSNDSITVTLDTSATSSMC